MLCEKRYGKVDKTYYLKLRDRYKPKVIKTIFILESPPASGKYFYDETGDVTEPLCTAFMRLLSYKPITKKEGLEYFVQTGHFLVDATYQPVNHLKEKDRERVILSNYNALVEDLQSLRVVDQSKLVLVKANIRRLLEGRLLRDGFNVINKGVIIPFPSSGQQRRFREMISKVYKFEPSNA
ncbi:MAG: hypothetical protein JRJ57_04080 [Deltaproteobacteria bacterium]|nr:hypothetical protein [Deltaproteobacteria bacterium]